MFVAACSVPAPAPVTIDDLVPVIFADGMTLKVPCRTHEYHVSTLISSEVLRIYNFTDDMGSVITATAEQVQNMLDMIATHESMIEDILSEDE